MNFILRTFNWRRCIQFTVPVLSILIVLNFYGLYTNKFYLLKPDNYIFPLLSVVHFSFLYVLRFKIREGEFTDPLMRNLEYALYVILMVYIFKILDTFYIVLSYKDYDDFIMPATFLPVGITMLIFQFLLVLLTLLAFVHRKVQVGEYTFDQINENFDSW